MLWTRNDSAHVDTQPVQPSTALRRTCRRVFFCNNKDIDQPIHLASLSTSKKFHHDRSHRNAIELRES